MPELNGGNEGRSSSTILDSWKEIAAFFRVSVRTVQNWEAEKRLPVHRMPGPRGRVYAYTDELDRWRSVFQGGKLPPEVGDDEAGDHASPHPHAPAAPIRPILGTNSHPHARREREAVRSNAIELGLWILLALLVVAGAAIFLQRIISGGPARWRVEGGVLVVMDSGGRELWQFAPEPALDSRLYTPERIGEGFSPLWAGDLDGDGDAEVLFPLRYGGGSGRNDELICFSSAGEIKWRFRTGGTVKSRDQEFTGPWQTRSFLVITDSRGLKRIVLTATHRISYPSQVVLLETTGQKIREYWHSGPLPHLHYGDYDGDRRGEVYLGGVSTTYKSAELLVLDPEDFDGASREANPRYQLVDLPARREKSRLIFGRSELNRRAEEFNAVNSFQVSDGQLVAAVREFNRRDLADPVVLYYFDAKLRLTKIEMTDGARAAYRQAASLRLIPNLDPDLELPSLAQGVRFLTPWR